jgi:hypothetical protein
VTKAQVVEHDQGEQSKEAADRVRGGLWFWEFRGTKGKIALDIDRVRRNLNLVVARAHGFERL